MKAIAHIYTDFPAKFGIPRQSGLVDALEARIVFEKEYAVPEAVRGLEEYSHIWLIWEFLHTERKGWSPTVRPPRLGGNRRMGVFATRSPFRPNPIGLSAVRLNRIELLPGEGSVLFVSGADLMNGTPIFDIKPYLPFTDSHPEASGGFADRVIDYKPEVSFDPELLSMIPQSKRSALLGVLAGDPRPSYQDDEKRVYGFVFAGFEIKFTVSNGKLIVKSVEKE